MSERITYRIFRLVDGSVEIIADNAGPRRVSALDYELIIVVDRDCKRDDVLQAARSHWQRHFSGEMPSVRRFVHWDETAAVSAEKLRDVMAEDAALEREGACRLKVDDALRRAGFPAAMRERLIRDKAKEVETLTLVRIPGLAGGGLMAPDLFALQQRGEVIEGVSVVCEIRITGGDLRMALHGLRDALRGVVTGSERAA